MAKEPSEFNGVLGARIRTLREIAGVSQLALANRIGKSRASISNIEAGTQAITLELAVRMAVALDLEVQDVIADDLKALAAKDVDMLQLPGTLSPRDREAIRRVIGAPA